MPPITGRTHPWWLRFTDWIRGREHEDDVTMKSVKAVIRSELDLEAAKHDFNKSQHVLEDLRQLGEDRLAREFSKGLGSHPRRKN